MVRNEENAHFQMCLFSIVGLEIEEIKEDEYDEQGESVASDQETEHENRLQNTKKEKSQEQ